ncbi:MAG: hypothetical protein RLZ98_604 [Pseudomonadota bacterium]|jgi:hypothetical protein
MRSNDARGLKRKCQNEECLMPFYDLNRKAFDCPNCGSVFDLETDRPASPPVRPGSAMSSPPRRWSKPVENLARASVSVIDSDNEKDPADDDAASDVDEDIDVVEADLSTDDLLEEDDDDGDTLEIRSGGKERDGDR